MAVEGPDLSNVHYKIIPSFFFFGGGGGGRELSFEGSPRVSRPLY